MLDPGRCEALACNSESRAYHWQQAAGPTTQEDEARLIESGKLSAEKARYQLVDTATGRPVRLHRGSIRWNEFRRKWIMIGNEEDFARNVAEGRKDFIEDCFSEPILTPAPDIPCPEMGPAEGRKDFTNRFACDGDVGGSFSWKITTGDCCDFDFDFDLSASRPVEGTFARASASPCELCRITFMWHLMPPTSLQEFPPAPP